MNGIREKEMKGRSDVCPQEGIFTRFLFVSAGMIAALCLFVSCGGGGSSGSSGSVLLGDVEGLDLPEHIEISDVGGNTGQSGFSGQAGYDDEGTDYTDQVKHSWTEDTEALDMVNGILGLVHDSAYLNFVNQGPYKALVSKVGDSEQSQSGSSSSSSTTEELMEITLNVTRQSDESPMIIKLWVREDDGPGGGPMLIRGYFQVTEGVSEQYPYGVMEAHFKGNRLDENGNPIPGQPLFTMAMAISAESGNITVQFVDAGEEEEGPFTYEWDDRARIIANSDLTEGNAYIYSAETDWDTQQLEEETFYFAFNADYFKFQEVGELDAMVLDKNSFSHKVFRYLLFDIDTGDRITRNSGFPLRLAGGEYGYLGYYGLWAPYEAEVEDGDQVTRADTMDDYWLVVIPGKLMKHTRDEILLEDMIDVEICVWDEGSDIIVTWDGSTFNKIGVRNFETGMIEYLENPEPYVFENEWDGGWVEALKAWLCLGNLTPANGDIVYFHAEETVDPYTAQDLDLYYWEFALDLPITQDVIDGSGAARDLYYSGQPVEKAYFYDSLSCLLKEEDILGAGVVMGDGLDLEGTDYMHGYHLSPLTTDANYTPETCWTIHEEEIFYSWNTGPNEWNRYVTVEDGQGVFASFEAPLKFSYTHSTDNDINDDAANDGKIFHLEFDGTDLHMPWYFDEASGDWCPAFNLKDGVPLTEIGSQQAAYVVKGIEEDLIMDEVTDPGIITQLEIDLPIDTSILPPTLTYKPTWTSLVGAVPSAAILKVIKGEVIELE